MIDEKSNTKKTRQTGAQAKGFLKKRACPGAPKLGRPHCVGLPRTKLAKGNGWICGDRYSLLDLSGITNKRNEADSRSTLR